MITRQLFNGQRLIDWTDDINNVDISGGLFSNTGLFSRYTTSQDAIMFEKSDFNTVLLKPTSRTEHNTQKSPAKRSSIHTLAMPYFNTQDYISRKDVQGYVQAGTDMIPETIANVVTDKMVHMRNSEMLTKEYMAFKAVQGVSVAPDGTVLADMFAEFGAAQEVLTWTLSDPNFDVRNAVTELKTKLQKSLRTGGVIRAIEVPVGYEFFNALISHPMVVADYHAYAFRDRAYYLDGDSTFSEYGVQNAFTYMGVTFMTIDNYYNLPAADGSFTQEEALATDEGFTMIRGVNDLYRQYVGNSNKLADANQQGRDLYMYQWDDPKGNFIELEMEFSTLYFPTQPQVIKKLVLA
jgi:hypothetical protein